MPQPPTPPRGGPEPGADPAYGQQPQYGQQPYGQPSFGPQSFGQQPPHAQPPYGQPLQYGQPQPASNKAAVIALVVGGVAIVTAIVLILVLVFTGDDEPDGRMAGGDQESSVPAAGEVGDLGDAEHNRLASACADEDWAACDELYWSTPYDSEGEEYGATCGARNEFQGGYCEERYRDGGDGRFGTAEQQRLGEACADGDWSACDDLYWQSPIRSYAEGYGATCGERNDADGGGCERRYG